MVLLSNTTIAYTAKNAQPVLAWWKQHWTMFCCPHCSRLSTILFNIVTPDCRLIQAHQLVQYCWQPWAMWAAQHCSMLFSSGQNRLCVFCCVAKLERPLLFHPHIGLDVNKYLRELQLLDRLNLHTLYYLAWNFAKLGCKHCSKWNF